MFPLTNDVAKMMDIYIECSKTAIANIIKITLLLSIWFIHWFTCLCLYIRFLDIDTLRPIDQLFWFVESKGFFPQYIVAIATFLYTYFTLSVAYDARFLEPSLINLLRPRNHS